MSATGLLVRGSLPSVKSAGGTGSADPSSGPPACVSRPRAFPGAGGDQIAFSRETAIDILVDAQGNRVERRRLPPNRCGESASLDRLGQYWRWLRGATSCRISDIDAAHLVQADVIGRLHVVNVGSSDPQEFSFDLHGYALPMGRYVKPSTHPVRVYAEATLRDYNTVRMTGVPLLQRVRARLDGVGYHYTRLILPLMGKRDRVAHLLVAIEREPGDAARIDIPQQPTAVDTAVDPGASSA